MNTLTIIIPGNPIAKKRPRFARRGKFVQTYNAQETEEGRFMWEVKNQLGAYFQPFDKWIALNLQCTFRFPVPRSASKKKITQMLDGTLKHTKKPDLDNCIKFVKDCLNKIVWHDDSQVVVVSARKEYSTRGETTIEIGVV